MLAIAAMAEQRKQRFSGRFIAHRPAQTPSGPCRHRNPPPQSLTLRPARLLAPLRRIEPGLPGPRRLLLPGFRQFGHPPCRWVSLQHGLDSLCWRDLHPLEWRLAAPDPDEPGAHHVPARLVLAVVMAAADREVVFGPNDLRAGLEAAGGQAVLHDAGLGPGVPNIGHRAGEQRPGLAPISPVVILNLA